MRHGGVLIVVALMVFVAATVMRLYRSYRDYRRDWSPPVVIAEEAEQRAEALLLSLLSPDEQARWHEAREVSVQRPDGSWLLVRPDASHTSDVTLAYYRNNRCYQVCSLIPSAIPVADKVATYVLLARADAEGHLPYDCSAGSVLGPGIVEGPFCWRN